MMEHMQTTPSASLSTKPPLPRLFTPASLALLTPKERNVIRYVVAGKSSSEISK